MGKRTEPNRQILLWAGFTAIAAAGVGFGVRTGILGDWGEQFGFTQSELGQITGGGLTGFGIIILIGSLLADKVGYGRLMISAFVMHLLSAVLTLMATPVFLALKETDLEAAKFWTFHCLFWGMFAFAIANGIAEAVVNPLVAALFPDNKTHYLNILHAGWPAGLVCGGLFAFFMTEVRWEVRIAMFLIPTLIYGGLLIGQRFPKSEAGAQGVDYLDMLKELGMLGAGVICILLGLFFYSDIAPVIVGDSSSMQLIVAIAAGLVILVAFGVITNFAIGPGVLATLLVIHAMVGYVELGTDSWITNITGNIMASPAKGMMLFVYTSALMFTLRFFAGPIVHQISPLGLLLVSAVLGSLGLVFLGSATTVLMCVAAATVYGIGKTYFWPTMLGVVSERFPKGGAITIGSVGGVGMLSAGLLGGPGIGYKQDYYASTQLQNAAPTVYEEYKSESENSFLFFPSIQGLDGTKVAAVRDTAANQRTPNETRVHDADLYGGRMALRLTAIVPATMAVCYLLLILYFKSQGGYRAVRIGEERGDASSSSGTPPD